MDERRARLVTLGCLIAAPAALLLITGIALGFALNGLVVGLVAGAGVAGAWEASRRWARGFEPLTIPAGGAGGAAFVALAYGELDFLRIAAAAASGWGIGLAACVFLLVFRPRSGWRIAAAVFVALAIAWLSLGISLSLALSFKGLLVAISFVLAAAAIEIVRDFVRAEGRIRPVLVAAASGVVVGTLFGAIGHWWYSFGWMVSLRPFSSPWLGAITCGVIAGLLYAAPLRLVEIVRDWSGMRSDGIVAIVVSVSSLGVVGGALARERVVLSLLDNTRVDEMFIIAMLVVVFYVPAYLMRRASMGTMAKIVVLAAIWLPVGILWYGPDPVTFRALSSTVSARDRLAMVPWRMSLGGTEDPRPRLVVARCERRPSVALRTVDFCATPENASRARSFRRVIVTDERFGDLAKAARLKCSPSALFFTPEGEEIDHLCEMSVLSSGHCLDGVVQNVIDGRKTFLYWRELAEREPRNAEAQWELYKRYAWHGMPEEVATTLSMLVTMPPEQNPHAYELLRTVVTERDVESAMRLIEAGVNPGDRRARGVLSRAVRRGLEDLVAVLLEGGADVAYARGKDGPPLHGAAGIGHAGIAELLIDAGADVNQTGRRGHTPLATAISAYSRDTAKLLIARGAKATEEQLARIESMPNERRLVKEPPGINALTVARDGTLFWAQICNDGPNLVKYDPATGETTVLLRDLRVVMSVSAGGGGVFIAEMRTGEKNYVDGRISRFDLATGRTETILDGLSQPQEMSAAPDGGIAFVDFSGQWLRLRRLHPGADEPETLIRGAEFAGQVATDHVGRTVALVRGRRGSQRLVAISADGSTRETIADDLPWVQDIAFDGEGNCFLAGSAGRGDDSGVLVLPTGDRGQAVPLRSGVSVSSIAVGPAGIIYYSTSGNEVRALEVDVAKAVKAAEAAEEAEAE
ncbi:MAG: ankyrin repeat domain-containing protein [Planctomycetota bacterium]|jgi:hypothetical protein